MPAHRDAAHAENYIGRTQFDVPWSVWGGEYLDSTQVIVGTLTRYKNGRFTLTFPVSENTKPVYLLWAHEDRTAQHSTGQHRTGQDSTAQHRTAQDST